MTGACGVRQGHVPTRNPVLNDQWDEYKKKYGHIIYLGEGCDRCVRGRGHTPLSKYALSKSPTQASKIVHLPFSAQSNQDALGVCDRHVRWSGHVSGMLIKSQYSESFLNHSGV